MKTLVILSLLWLAGDPRSTVSVLRARYAYAHSTRPELPDSLSHGTGAPPPQFDLELNRDVVTAALARPQRELIVYSQPFHQCPPCKALFNAVGEGDAELHLEWVKTNLPAWVTATPTIYDPQTNQYRVGVQTLEQLRNWTGAKAAIASEPPVMGTIHNGSAFDDALDSLRHFLGDTNTLRLERGGTIPLGNLAAVVPSPLIARWDIAGDVKRLTFDGQKPLLRAWGMQVPCDGVTYDGDTLTLQIPRFPDWKLRVARDVPD